MTDNYVVWLKPKYAYVGNNTSIPERVLIPKYSDVKWSKKRAKEEAEFLRKNGKFSFDKNYSMPYKFSELYTYRVISESDAIKRGLI